MNFKRITNLAVAAGMALSLSAMAKDYTPGFAVTAQPEEGLIPLRSVCEDLGYEVNWYMDGAKIDVVKGESTVTFAIDVNSFKVNDNDSVTLENAPKLINDKTYVSKDFFVKLLNADVSENGTEIAIPSVAVLKEITKDAIVVTDEILGDINVLIPTSLIGDDGFKIGTKYKVIYGDKVPAGEKEYYMIKSLEIIE